MHAERGREIAVLNGLVRAACRGADTCAAALQATPGPDWRVLLERLREDRRLLLVDLVRCLLLRGLPVPRVRAAMTEVLGPADPSTGFAALRADLELAERGLESQLRRVLADTLVSQPTLEVLSLHYLRLKMRLKEFESAGAAPDAGDDGAPTLPWAADLAAGGIGLLH